MKEIILNSTPEADRVLFIFHGYGADAENLKSVGEIFGDNFPKTEIHIPDGPEKCRECATGRQWFDLAGDDVNVWNRSCVKDSSMITEYVDSVLSKKNLSYSDAVFSGFSQGAMLSLYLGLKHNVKGIISFSGILLCAEEIKHSSASSKVLLAHGEQDAVIPFESLKITEEALKHIGVDVETAVSPGIGHAIDNYLLTRAVDFLKRL
ncbi:MAG: dienelactone hydrolase family protein [Holosporaceae bacterium]|jgi:phospholipase/carboxylesterase|nr:dienelactone hydrolase family protein [Holosporaceae bacterium]